MKKTIIGLLAMAGLLFAGQASADMVSAFESCSEPLSMRLGECSMSGGAEGISETWGIMQITSVFGGDTTSGEQVWSGIPDTTDQIYGTFHGLYDSYTSVVTSRHITLQRGTDETDRAGITLYKITDVVNLPKGPDGRIGDSGFANMVNSILFEGLLDIGQAATPQ